MLRRAALQVGRLTSSLASQTRGFADAPFTPEISFKVPAVVHGIAGRYASSLWMAAAKANTLTQVEQDVGKVLDAAKENSTLMEFMMDPCVSRISKSAGMREVLSCLEVGEITSNFFAVMADNGRLQDVYKTFSLFVTLMEAHRGEVRAVVTAAEELEPEESRELENSLKKLLEPGQNLLLSKKVDPKIIGGLVVELGDKYIDLSISQQLRDIEKLLTETL